MKIPAASTLAGIAAFSLFGFVSAQEKKKKEPTPAADDIVWTDVTDWGVEGQGWPVSALASTFDRLPAKSEKIVRPPVWSLSRHSAGIATRFNTDATTLHIRYTLGGSNLAMPHMPATGVSGVDFYALDTDKKWKWVEVTRPSKGTEVVAKITDLDPGMRAWMAYFPLYNSVLKMEIGVPKGSKFQGIAPRTEGTIVFYGTSITHGACASRPGMAHPSILGRRLDRPIINLGFSGNGKMEPEVGALLSELDPAVFVIDCLPNMNADLVAERAEPLVRKLREARPDTPIVLVEDRSNTNSWIHRARREHHKANRAALVRAFDNLVSSGVKDLYYIQGEDLLGDDTEGATDGSHPSDLGFMRQADKFEPVLRQALGME